MTPAVGCFTKNGITLALEWQWLKFGVFNTVVLSLLTVKCRFLQLWLRHFTLIFASRSATDRYCVIFSWSKTALFNRCAWCTLECTKICVGCTTMEGFTRMHYKLVTLNRYFVQKLSVSKNEPLTNQWLSGFKLGFAQSKNRVPTVMENHWKSWKNKFS